MEFGTGSGKPGDGTKPGDDTKPEDGVPPISDDVLIIPVTIIDGKIVIDGGNITGGGSTGNGGGITTGNLPGMAGLADTVAAANAAMTPEQIQLISDGKTIEIRIEVTDISMFIRVGVGEWNAVTETSEPVEVIIVVVIVILRRKKETEKV